MVHITAAAADQSKSSRILQDMAHFGHTHPGSCDLNGTTTPVGVGAAAIFIDDSFRERLDVHERVGIPVFDCSMLSVLIDEVM